MKQFHGSVSIGELCRLFGYRSQSYYKWLKSSEKQKCFKDEILKIVRSIRKDQPRLGTKKLQYKVNEELENRSIGRDRLYGILREEGLLIRQIKKYRPKHTDGDGNSLYPDLRKELIVKRINQLWCSDITYIELRTAQRFCYLICVTDEYSHLIVGYYVSLHMRRTSVLKAMQMAVKSQLPTRALVFKETVIIHSDRGSQYKSKDFQDFVDTHNMKSSMTAKGKSYENPVAERLNGIIKNELLEGRSFDSFEQAAKAIDKAIMIYNEQRPHLSCNMLTPKAAHEQKKGPLKKLWKQRKKSKD